MFNSPRKEHGGRRKTARRIVSDRHASNALTRSIKVNASLCAVSTELSPHRLRFGVGCLFLSFNASSECSIETSARWHYSPAPILATSDRQQSGRPRKYPSAFPCQTPSPILRDWSCTKYAASGGTCNGDLPLKTPQRGSGKSEQSQ